MAGIKLVVRRLTRLRAVFAATLKHRQGKALAASSTAFAAAIAAKEIGDGMAISPSVIRPVIVGTFIAIFVSLAWLVIAIVRALCKDAPDQVGEDDLGPETGPPPGPYFCRVLDSVEDAKRLTTDVTSQVFPKTNIPLNVVEAAQTKNNRRLIALIERSTDKTIGWATVWPVSSTAGVSVETGKLPDDELTAADMLVRADNTSAEYIVILAVGILPEYRNLPGSIALKTLGRCLLWHLHDEFYSDDIKCLRIIAIGDSKEGRRMCASIGLLPNGYHTKFINIAEPKPVYSATLTRKDLQNLIKIKF